MKKSEKFGCYQIVTTFASSTLAAFNFMILPWTVVQCNTNLYSPVTQGSLRANWYSMHMLHHEGRAHILLICPSIFFSTSDTHEF